MPTGDQQGQGPAVRRGIAARIPAGLWTLIFWFLFAVGSWIAFDDLWNAHRDPFLGFRPIWWALFVGIAAGIVLGGLQALAVGQPLAFRPEDFAVAPDDDERRTELGELWTKDYELVKRSRDFASESGARLLRLLQFGVLGLPALIVLDDILGVPLTDPLRSALLSAGAVVFAIVVADFLHWQHDVKNLEDYIERYLRPALGWAYGGPVLRQEEFLTSVRNYGNWGIVDLLSMRRKAWVDPFVVKQFGQALVLGLLPLYASVRAIEFADRPGLVLFGVFAGLIAMSVFASYCKIAGEVLRLARYTASGRLQCRANVDRTESCAPAPHTWTRANDHRRRGDYTLGCRSAA